ncbi:MAG: hypothetical protein SF029_24295 [bacterium]|nr:hypothetical protein [bacterium]
MIGRTIDAHVEVKVVAVSENRQTNNEELLQLAIKAAKSGQKDSARVMFRRVWDSDRRSETAMMWLAKLSKSQKERQEWLTRVIKVNPNNETAKEALRKMQRTRAASENRTLLLFGMVAVVMIVLAIAIVVLVSVL